MNTESDFIVPAKSWDDIGALASRVRAQFGLSDQLRFPIMDLLERILDQELSWLRLEIETKQQMNEAEGYTCPNGTFIRLREDVYNGAWSGNGRDRFTAAHELGHFAMHTGTPLARATRQDDVPSYRLAEPQANQFAAELLMPVEWVRRSDSGQELAARFGVSHEAACRRLGQLIKRGKI